MLLFHRSQIVRFLTSRNVALLLVEGRTSKFGIYDVKNYKAFTEEIAIPRAPLQELIMEKLAEQAG